MLAILWMVANVIIMPVVILVMIMIIGIRHKVKKSGQNSQIKIVPMWFIILSSLYFIAMGTEYFPGIVADYLLIQKDIPFQPDRRYAYTVVPSSDKDAGFCQNAIYDMLKYKLTAIKCNEEFSLKDILVEDYSGKFNEETSLWSSGMLSFHRGLENCKEENGMIIKLNFKERNVDKIKNYCLVHSKCLLESNLNISKNELNIYDRCYYGGNFLDDRKVDYDFLRNTIYGVLYNVPGKGIGIPMPYWPHYQYKIEYKRSYGKYKEIEKCIYYRRGVLSYIAYVLSFGGYYREGFDYGIKFKCISNGYSGDGSYFIRR